MKASKTVSTRSVTTKLITTASVGALLLGMASVAQADNWRYAHEEYEGDVQDVFAYAFKEYIEENSDNTVQVYRFGELGESDLHYGTDAERHPAVCEPVAWFHGGADP